MANGEAYFFHIHCPRLFKLSVLAFYRRFLPRQPYRRWIYTTAACSVLFSIAAAIVSPTPQRFRLVDFHFLCSHFDLFSVTWWPSPIPILL